MRNLVPFIRIPLSAFWSLWCAPYRHSVDPEQ
jgi:hypothetical protein